MHDTPDTEQAAVALAFLQRYGVDRMNGVTRPLAEYQAQFPGFEAVIAQEYSTLGEDAIPESVHLRMHERFGSDSNPRVSLRGTRDLQRGDPPGTTRYATIGELARGGMGTVFQAWDRDLRRPVAMKVLRRKTQPDGALTRFLEEAQVTAQLNHPGIVAVHELGVDADGRAYFTMSLLRGVTFGEIIDRVHSGDGEWTLARAVGVLQRVGEAVAFAHEQGVVHRDLKPANVMVGNFGETYVVDWGLAAVNGNDAEAPVQSTRRELVAARAGGGLATHDGDILGTPAYMAPEQARGDTGAIGMHTDVYAIGAMLYQLLAGEPPFSGSTPEILAAVGAARPRSLHDIARAAPVELVAICEQAMAGAPSDRYASAVALAEDLRAWLEQRVVRAYETGAIAELRKWVRRNKPLALASAVAAVVLVAGLAVSLVLMDREGRAAARATKNSTLAFAAVDQMLSRVGSERLLDVPQMDAVRRDLLADALRLLERLEAQGDDPASRLELASGLYQVGRLQHTLGDYAAAVASRRRAAGLLDVLRREGAGSAASWLLVKALTGIAAGLRASGEFEASLEPLQQSATLAEQLLSRGDATPEQRASHLAVLTDTSASLGGLGRHDEALPILRQGVEHWRTLAAEAPERHGWFRSNLALSLTALGSSLAQNGKFGDAHAPFREGLQLYEELVTQYPDRSLYRELATTNGMNYVGEVLFAERQYEAGSIVLISVIARARTLVADFPARITHRLTLGGALCNLGYALNRLDRSEEAVAPLQDAVAVLRAALEHSPKSANARLFLLNAHGGLCQALSEVRQYEAAAASAEAICALSFGGERARRLAACFFGACAEQAAQDGRADLGEHYAQRTLATLGEAIDMGLADVKFLEQEYFDAIRDRAEFEQLRTRMKEGR